MTPPAYQAYLLRLWRTSEAHWRASLEDAHSGERLTFATLGQLSEFLQRATAASPHAAPEETLMDEMNGSADAKGGR